MSHLYLRQGYHIHSESVWWYLAQDPKQESLYAPRGKHHGKENHQQAISKPPEMGVKPVKGA